MRAIQILPGLILIFIMSVAKLSGAEQKDIFADPQNLKVLPNNVSPAELSQTMKSFAMGLGLRCNDCHVGEPNAPLSNYDFAADDKVLKRKARVMLQMVKEINDVQLTRLDQFGTGARVEVECVSCHRGQSKPRLIQDVLAEKFADGGIEQVVTGYKELRNRYYGSHTFDFGEFVLPMFSRDNFKEKAQLADAVVLLKTNIEYFPESYFGYYALAEAYEMLEDKPNAIKSYQQALRLNPRASFLEQKIKALSDH
jgi:tetratricopeptide (TPR) repeat protein